MSTTARRLAVFAAVALLGTTALVGSACGEAAPEDPTPVKTWKITPASGDRDTPTPAAATATREPQGTPPAGGVVLEIVGANTLFDKDELEAPAGTITVRFDNKDAGVVHNIHFYKGDDAKADTLATTDLEAGPVVQEVTFTAEPGEYYYQCDAHPATMSGTLKVS
jgi:plastocyanin